MRIRSNSHLRCRVPQTSRDARSTKVFRLAIPSELSISPNPNTSALSSLSCKRFCLLLASLTDGGTGGPFRSEHRVGAGVPVNGVERCRLLPGREHRAVARCARLRGLAYENTVTLRITKCAGGTSVVRSQKASSETKCPTGRTWSGSERRKWCGRPDPSINRLCVVSSLTYLVNEISYPRTMT